MTRPPVHHVRRGKVPTGTPAHVILRVRDGIPVLRCGKFLREWRRSLRAAREREGFRAIHYSVQGNHAHLIVEAPGGKRALSNGMKSVAARFARCVNRTFARSGPVLYGRYNVKLLGSPRQVRHALAYVLLNARKHWKERRAVLPPGEVDPCSSGRWFDGWKRGQPLAGASREPSEVALPRFWMLRKGWRRHGLLALSEIPGAA